MPDLITYSPDVTLLGPELLVKRPDYVMQRGDDFIFLVPKVPTRRIGNETLSMVRAMDSEVALFDGIDNVQVLGTREQVFADPVKLAIYRKFYPEGSTQVTALGVTVTANNPEMPVIL